MEDGALDGVLSKARGSTKMMIAIATTDYDAVNQPSGEAATASTNRQANQSGSNTLNNMFQSS